MILFTVVVCGSMRLMIIAAASLAVVSCASLSLEDLEFNAWKLKFGEADEAMLYICRHVHFLCDISPKVSNISMYNILFYACGCILRTRYVCLVKTVMMFLHNSTTEKSYNSFAEEAQRKLTWLSTRLRVLAHNILADQGVKTYRMGMNQFSDMVANTYHEQRRITID